jgi:hypothetical protein
MGKQQQPEVTLPTRRHVNIHPASISITKNRAQSHFCNKGHILLRSRLGNVKTWFFLGTRFSINFKIYESIKQWKVGTDRIFTILSFYDF